MDTSLWPNDVVIGVAILQGIRSLVPSYEHSMCVARGLGAGPINDDPDAEDIARRVYFQSLLSLLQAVARQHNSLGHPCVKIEDLEYSAALVGFTCFIPSPLSEVIRNPRWEDRRRAMIPAAREKVQWDIIRAFYAFHWLPVPGDAACYLVVRAPTEEALLQERIRREREEVDGDS